MDKSRGCKLSGPSRVPLIKDSISKSEDILCRRRHALKSPSVTPANPPLPRESPVASCPGSTKKEGTKCISDASGVTKCSAQPSDDEAAEKVQPSPVFKDQSQLRQLISLLTEELSLA